MATGGQTTEMTDFPVVPQPDNCSAIMATMWQHQQEGMFTDFSIKVKNMTIPCHRIVLSSASAYFAVALNADFKEKRENEIHFENIDSDAMLNIVRFMYGQNATFKTDSLASVLDAIEILQLDSMKNQISQFLSENLSRENFVYWWKLASMYGLEDLRKTSIEMILSTITVVCSSDDFKTLTIEELIDITRAEDVELYSMDRLVAACVEWVDDEPQTRKENLRDIIMNIDLTKCSTATIKTLKKKYHDLLQDASADCMIINELFERFPESQDNVAVTRNKRLVILGGMTDDCWRGEINNKCFVAWSEDGDQWEECAEIPAGFQAERSPMVVTSDGFIVMCGGDDCKKTTRYDASSKSWHRLPACPAAIKNAAAVLCGNSLYLLGGGTVFTPLASVYRIDLVSLSWHREADMPKKLPYSPLAAALNTNIYVVEGQKLTMFAAETEKTWHQRSNVPWCATSQGGSSLLASDDGLYLVGGQERLAVCYHEPTDKWTKLTCPSMANQFGSAALFNGKIYLIGHSDSSHSNVSVYDINDNQWSVLPHNLPFKQISFCTAAAVEWL